MDILNKQGMLTDEDRKQKLEHGCNNFTFETCVDLSKPVKVIPYGIRKEFTLSQYSQDVASFICWWTHFVQKDLNGFSGFSHVKFEPVGFTVLTEDQINQRQQNG